MQINTPLAFMWPVGYSSRMNYYVVTTDVFNLWLARIRDRQAAKLIAQRLDRLVAGNMGDVKPVGVGVSEMRIFDGPGYRLYFTIRNDELIILLCGGNKSSQSRDIARAKRILSELEV